MNKYFIEGDTLYEVWIRQDEDQTPRDYDHCTHMCVWWNRYSLGDYEEIRHYTPMEYLEELISDRLPDADALYKKPLEMLEMLYADKDFMALPIYIYEHGMITISTSNIVNPYGHWDSGMAGFIWTDRDSYVDMCGDVEDWRDAAAEMMKQEVEEYDMYLQGEVFCMDITPYDLEMQDFDDSLSDYTGSFYSRKYGDDLALEMIREETNANIYDDFESALADYKKELIKSGRVWDALQIA